MIVVTVLEHYQSNDEMRLHKMLNDEHLGYIERLVHWHSGRFDLCVGKRYTCMVRVGVGRIIPIQPGTTSACSSDQTEIVEEGNSGQCQNSMRL